MRKWVENFYKIGREVHDDEPPIHISLHLQWLFLFIWSRHHDPSFGFSTSDLVVCRKQDRSPGAVKHSSREGLTIGCTVGVLRKFFQREKESTRWYQRWALGLLSFFLFLAEVATVSGLIVRDQYPRHSRLFSAGRAEVIDVSTRQERERRRSLQGKKQKRSIHPPTDESEVIEKPAFKFG